MNPIAEFWQDFTRRNAEIISNTTYQVWHFGDNRDLGDELCDLVLQGRKHATACLVWEAELDPDNAPVLNGYAKKVANL